MGYLAVAGLILVSGLIARYLNWLDEQPVEHHREGV